jgi:spermidine/putrescine transport system permease protein
MRSLTLGKASLRERWQVAVLLAPVFALLVACMVVPLSIMLLYSFWQSQAFSLVKELSVGNYLYVLGSPVFVGLTGKAVLYGLTVTAITLVIGFPVAYFLARRVTFTKALWIHAIIIPLFTSDLIRYFAWRTILGSSGVLNDVLLWSGLVDEPVRALINGPIAVVISLTHVYLPFMILALWASLEAIDPALIHAAMDLGARPARVFRKVVLPLALPGLVAGSLFVFVPVTGEYFGVNMMGGTTGFTITNAINDQFTSAMNWPLGSAMSFVLLFAIGFVVLAFLAGVRSLAVLRYRIGSG